MKIVFVLECANAISNGTGATCYRFANELHKRGHQIVMVGERLAPGVTTPFTYVGLPHYNFPIFEGLIRKEGFNFVKCDAKILYQAIKGADLVHLFLPFKLSSTARLIAETLDVPVSCAFHLQPQNITSAIHLGKVGLVNDVLFYSFRKYLYNHVRHVHCPSDMIMNQLKEHHYRNNVCHVISNGITPFFHRIPAEKPAEFKDRIVITMSGRLAGEKRQDIIIKAVARSRYNKDIQVVFCGQGPKEKRYFRIAKKRGLANPLFVKFCNAEELREILSYTDIYVHASDFEIEGISAIEAIACGAVPIISDSRLSATSSFALSQRCVFRHGSSKALAERIDYFIEHPLARQKLSFKYQKEGEAYHLDNMVDLMERMFAKAVEDHQEGNDIPQVRVRKKDVRKKRHIFKRLVKQGVIDELPETLR